LVCVYYSTFTQIGVCLLQYIYQQS